MRKMQTELAFFCGIFGSAFGSRKEELPLLGQVLLGQHFGHPATRAFHFRYGNCRGYSAQYIFNIFFPPFFLKEDLIDLFCQRLENALGWLDGPSISLIISALICA